MFTDTAFIQNLIIAVVVGAASGSIGAFIILERMALVGDALSHVALPGIALALAYGIDPFFGVLVSLALAGVIIWRLEYYTQLPTDALVGILFTGSLAVGILTIPNTEIIESLFGAFPVLSVPMFVGVVGCAVVMIVLSFIYAQKFLFQIVSRDLAKVYGVGEKYHFLLLAIFVLVVALGIKLVGTLLMGALTIIPATIARNITRKMKSYMVLSAVLGGAISVLGTVLARQFNLLPGPTIILIGTFIFLCSLAFSTRPAKSA
jgi:ABC-type Mn2+/Zn2+ transport system permease subunit